MRKPIICSMMALFCFWSFASLAKDPKCEIQKWTQSSDEAIPVPVTVMSGAEVAKPNFVMFREIDISAIFTRGDSFELQSSFEMKMGDISSKLSDVTEESILPSLETSKFIFRCWFE